MPDRQAAQLMEVVEEGHEETGQDPADSQAFPAVSCGSCGREV